MNFLGQRGFSLIEVLSALVVLSGVFLILGEIRSGNRKRIAKTGDYHKVVYLMEQKMVELEFDWRKKSFSSIPKEDKGDFPEENYFSWSVKTQALEVPDPAVVMNHLGQSEPFANQVARVSAEFLEEAVLEVKLTIHYKKGDLKSDYSIATYFVDHAKEISFLNSGALTGGEEEGTTEEPPTEGPTNLGPATPTGPAGTSPGSAGNPTGS